MGSGRHRDWVPGSPRQQWGVLVAPGDRLVLGGTGVTRGVACGWLWESWGGTRGMAWVGDMAAVAPLSPHCPPEVFPQQMEGVKLIVNKTLSSHFQVRGHTGTRGAMLGGERGLPPVPR